MNNRKLSLWKKVDIRKDGISKLPGQDCRFTKYAEFFVYLLELNNHMFLTYTNRPFRFSIALKHHYNETYEHLVKTFPSGGRIERVQELCLARSIGNSECLWM